MIIREKIFIKIRPFYEQDLIKVIIGELKANGIPETQIIYINFEYEDYAFIKK